jgi:GDSL-like lipase/acylhydrolase family protein
VVSPQVLAGTIVAIALAFPATAVALPSDNKSAIIALGDSFISGEGGRWEGNSLDDKGTRSGSDRAALCADSKCTYDPSRVYGDSAADGCDRSDVAEIKTAEAKVDQRLNVACSGAETVNIWRSSNGGKPFKGERPQAEQLGKIGNTVDVELVALSIGGNDLRFADTLQDCIQNFLFGSGPCNVAEEKQLRQRLPDAMKGLAKAIDEIQAVLRADGFPRSKYELVVQSNPSPLPTGGSFRYPDTDYSRFNQGGCPIYDADATWAQVTAVPLISNSIRQVAADRGATFLDLSQALVGREVCNSATIQATADKPPSATTHEWTRWVDSSSTQGRVEESLHPNAFGQRAFGECLEAVFERRTGADFACFNTPGTGAKGMVLKPLG